MRKRILFVVLAVSILIMSSYAFAVKPDSPPGQIKDKDDKAPGQWKKTEEYESQRHFVHAVHMQILDRMQYRYITYGKEYNPIGLLRLVDEFLLALEQQLLEILESEPELKIEITGDIDLFDLSEVEGKIDEINATFECPGKFELKLKVKKQDNLTNIERNATEGALSEDQLLLWYDLVDIVKVLVNSTIGDDIELEIEIEYECEVEEELEETELEELEFEEPEIEELEEEE
jgi:hypothetical protein